MGCFENFKSFSSSTFPSQVINQNNTLPTTTTTTKGIQSMSHHFSVKKRNVSPAPCSGMALISAPALVAKAVVVCPGQMWGFSGWRCRFRLAGPGLLLPLRLMARSTTFLASWPLPGRLIPPIPRDSGACKGEGECAGELSTHVQISWGSFPSSLLLSPPLEMKREGNVCALQRFYQYVWTEAPHGGMAPPHSPGTALSAVEPRRSSDIHSMGP